VVTAGARDENMEAAPVRAADASRLACRAGSTALATTSVSSWQYVIVAAGSGEKIHLHSRLERRGLFRNECGVESGSEEIALNRSSDSIAPSMCAG
jgi:hypothetical protein